MAEGNGVAIFDEENGVLFRVYKEKKAIIVEALDFIERKRLELPPGLGESPFFSDTLQAFTVRGKDYSIILRFLHHKIMESFSHDRDPINVIKEYLNMVLKFALTERTGWLKYATIEPLKDVRIDPHLLRLSRILREKGVRAFFINDKYFLGFYHYDGRRWVDMGTDPFTFISRFVDGELRDVIVERYGSREGKVRNALIQELQHPFRPAEGMLAFENGVFSWPDFERTGSLAQALKPHSPDYLVTNYIPWRLALERLKGLESFLPPRSEKDLMAIFERLAPKASKTFRAWVETDREEETLKYTVLLLEVIGYTLYPHRYPFKKAFIFLGSGDNGKTTYLNVIMLILGRENYASLTFSQLTEGRFELAELFGKLANLTSEPPVKISGTDRIKALTGDGDEILVQRKYRDPIPLRNYAKLIFSANTLPKVDSTDVAFWNRWIIVDFPNVFPRNPNFFEETFTPEEIEGIIISALYAFYLALERGSFIDNPDYEEIMDRWNRESEVLIKAYEELFGLGILGREDPPFEHYILKDHLTELINDRLRRYGQKPKDTGSIYRVLKKRYPYLEKLESRPRIGDKRVIIFNGIKILQCDEVERVVGPINYPPCNERRGDYNVFKYSL